MLANRSRYDSQVWAAEVSNRCRSKHLPAQTTKMTALEEIKESLPPEEVMDKMRLALVLSLRLSSLIFCSSSKCLEGPNTNPPWRKGRAMVLFSTSCPEMSSPSLPSATPITVALSQ